MDELVVERAVTFSGEEGHGRFLDLHECARFLDGKLAPRASRRYLRACDDFASTPRATKFSAAYGEYLDGLFEYLKSFHERAVPLRFVEESCARRRRRLTRAGARASVPDGRTAAFAPSMRRARWTCRRTRRWKR